MKLLNVTIFNNRILRWTLWPLGFLSIFYISLLQFIYLATPYLQTFQPQITAKANSALGRLTTIGSVEAAVYRLQPVLRLHNVNVFAENNSRLLWRVNEVDVGVNLLRSLWNGRLEIGLLRLNGVVVVLKTTAAGEISINGIPLAANRSAPIADSSHPSHWEVQLTNLLAHNRIIIDDVALIWQKADASAVKFNQLSFKLINNWLRHKVTLRGKMQWQKSAPSNPVKVTDKIPAHFTIKLSFNRVPRLDYRDLVVSGEMHSHNLSLLGVPGLSAAKSSAVQSDFVWYKFLPQQGKIKLHLHNTTIVAPQWFAKSVVWDNLSGDLGWQNAVDAVKLQIHGMEGTAFALETQGEANISLPKNVAASPEVDLQLNFIAEHLEKLHSYFPLAIMPPQLVDWLKHAFSEQGAVDGSFVLRGNLARFPFTSGDGLFRININLDDVDLLYDREWPKLAHTRGQLLFTGKSMEVRADQAEIAAVPLHNIRATIADLTAPTLIINGHVSTNGGVAQRFVNDSPLRSSVGKKLKYIVLKGPLDLDLKIVVPLLDDEQPAHAIGKIFLNNHSILIPMWSWELQRVHGNIDFVDNDIVAPDLKGWLFERAISLQVKTTHRGAAGGSKKRSASDEGALQISFSHALPVATLLEHFSLPLAPYVKGNFAYQGILRLPWREDENTTLDIFSNLQGAQISASPLLAKAANISTNFKLGFTFTDDFARSQILVRYADKISAALEFKRAKGEDSKFKSGMLRFGDALASVPSRAGLTVTGKLDKVDWSKWEHYFNQEVGQNGGGAKEKRRQVGQRPHARETKALFPLELINQIVLDINEFYGWGQTLPSLHLEVVPRKEDWVVSLQNPTIEGKLIIPHAGSQKMVMANFRKVYLNEAEEDLPINPRELPPLYVSIGELRYGAKSLGHVEFQTTPITNGVEIEQLKINAANFQLEARGQWVQIRGFVQSRVEGKWSSKNMGNALKQLGFTENLDRGVGVTNFALVWNGPFYNPDIISMNGRVSTGIRGGRIVNLEGATEAKMGIGKLLSIIGLQTLPRRLTLDFSDLVRNGFSFDMLKGEFKLINGDAFTDNTIVHGPVAQVKVSGRVGFAKKDYDMSLAVAPRFTSSLPVIATFTGGPIIGAATWVADKLVGSQVSRVITYIYQVKGSWASPDIKKL